MRLSAALSNGVLGTGAGWLHVRPRGPARAPRVGRRRRRVGVVLAATASLALHAAVGVYLWKAKFEPNYRQYAEEVTNVELVKPRPPPPPPPPPPSATPPPPPKLQPRPPATTLDLPLTIPPLPVAPVETRIETPAPPRIVEAPAPPAPPPEPPRSPVIQTPDWLRRPSGEDMARYYPARAQRMGVEGRATLSCTVGASGALQACAVASETPADQDFGAAALRMARLFKMRPMTKDGEPVSGGLVRIPIRFVLPKDEAA